MERESFIFYASFLEGIEALNSAEEKWEAVKAIFDYGLKGIDKPPEGYSKIPYIMAKPQIDANNQRYENGKLGAEYGRLGGAPKGNQNARKKQPQNNPIGVELNNPETTPNVNVNDNVNVNVNDNVNVNENVNKNNKNTMCKAEALALFERVWKLYPNKKGKAQVSETQKKRLLTIGESALVKAIERYKTALLQDGGWRKPQNGSTFFNSGYVDYLDENYEPYSFATKGAKSIGEYESEFDRRVREAKERGETLPDDEQFDF